MLASADKNAMSVVACTGIGSRGVEFSPGLGGCGVLNLGASSLLERNLAALASRGVALAPIRGEETPEQAGGATATPTDEQVAAWIASQPALHEGFVPPIVVCGLGTTAMLRGVWNATNGSKDGYTPRLWVVEPDGARATRGLSECDLAEIIADERVGFLLGPGSFERLREALVARPDTPAQHLCVSDTGTPSELTGVASRVLDEVAAAHERARARLRARVAAIYAERDASWWASRFASAASGGEPLRVLLPSCRYTTFVQHAARDLANAFERRGVRAEVLLERDSHSRLSSVAYLEQLASLKPDLVVLINYPRESLGLDMPRNIPVVCWMQDAMPHLFDAKIGAMQGDFDFVMGHTFPELYAKFGYPMERTMPSVVVADGAKFHSGEVRRDLRERHACEIALVSHHSEPPDTMHERLRREVGKDAAVVRVLDELRPFVRETVRASMDVAPVQRLRFHAEAVWREQIGEEPPASALSLLINNYAIPLADRELRHETISWAADMARRRGWRLALYGRGWEKNPRHSEFARGELSHGEELRAVYASAGVNLHASLTALVHQRVIECVLSGGVCLLRMTRDAIAGARATLTRSLLCHPAEVEEPDRIGYVLADHAEAMAFAALEQRLGMPRDDGVFWIPRAKADATRRMAPLQTSEQDAHWVFGELSEIGFAGAARLEELVERAIERPEWRRNVSAMSSRRPARHLTHEALAGRLINFVRAGFERVATPRRAAA